MPTYERAYVLNIKRIKYWIAHGAIPTDRVHHILAQFGILPKKPPIFGSKYLLPPRPKEYSPTVYKNWLGIAKTDYEQYTKFKVREELDLLETRIDLEQTIYKENDIEKVQTDDIDSEEQNIFERTIKFIELQKRFDKHKDYSLKVLKGNDYKFNVYLRKMDKLSNRRFGGIDLEGYKDYINNITKFQKIKQDWTRNNYPGLDDHFECKFLSFKFE